MRHILLHEIATHSSPNSNSRRYTRPIAPPYSRYRRINLCNLIFFRLRLWVEQLKRRDSLLFGWLLLECPLHHPLHSLFLFFSREININFNYISRFLRFPFFFFFFNKEKAGENEIIRKQFNNFSSLAN